MSANTGLAVAKPTTLATLAGELIRTPQQLAERVRELQSQAHILSPAVAVSNIPEHYAINTAVVVIEPSSTSGDVYAGSFHKKVKQGGDWIPTEVSLAKPALLRILGAAGVNITRSERTDDQGRSYYWRWCSEGTLVDFDGQIRRLPPGNVEVDYRDGSAQIGEWTPEEWAKRVAAADAKREKAPQGERWKVKPEPIGGWTYERVMQSRSKGERLAESFSLNALIRNLGIKQKYTIEELKKPFVCFRATFIPNMRNPRVEEMVTAAHLGATHLLYGHASDAQPRAIGPVIDVHASSPAGEETSEVTTAPEGAVEFDDLPEPPKPSAPATPEPPADVYHVTKSSKFPDSDHFFFETRQGKTFTTSDLGVARALNAARKAGQALQIHAEAIDVAGKPYLNVLDVTAVPSLPDPSKL